MESRDLPPLSRPHGFKVFRRTHGSSFGSDAGDLPPVLGPAASRAVTGF